MVAVVQIFKVAEDASDECKKYAESHMSEIVKAANDAIASSTRESEVNSLTDPAFFKLRKEPIEHVHKSLMEQWDTIKGGDKAFFVFISSLKNGIKTVKRKRVEPVAPSPKAPAAAPGAAAGATAVKKRRTVKQLAATEVEAVFDRVTARSTLTIANLCGLVGRLQSELAETKKELVEARVVRCRRELYYTKFMFSTCL